MKRLVKYWMLCLSLIMAFGCAFPAMASSKKAAETRTSILSVALNISSYIEAGDESAHVEVTSNDSQYSVGNVDWGTIPADGFKVGEEPKIKIYLHAHAGYYFDKSVNTKKIIVNGAQVTGAKRKDNDETLEVSVKLGKVSGELEDPETAEWVGYPLGKATWEKVEGANAYELKLYRDNQIVFSVEKCVGTIFDFFPYMTQSGTYHFRVRTVPVSTEEAKYLTPGEWVYSDSMDIDADETSTARFNDGSTTKNNTPSNIGWKEDRDGWYYLKSDGSYYKNTWQAIGGKWYYFGYDGYMLTGWQQIAGNTYYLSGNGDMQTGWLEYGKEWYFLNPSNGVMQTGWNLSNGRWYYMNPADGKMQTGWKYVGDRWYYLDSSDGGAMAVNRNVGGRYVNQDGVWVQ